MLQESGQWLENVDRTHLVSASDKLALENDSYCWCPLAGVTQGRIDKKLSLVLGPSAIMPLEKYQVRFSNDFEAS